MKLICLGSSSRGNCFLLDNGSEALMLECGVPFQEVMKAINFNVSRIVGCLISHEHTDHSKYWQKVLDNQIPIYCSSGTASVLTLSFAHIHCINNCTTFRLGSFLVQPFETIHDAKEPLGFLIYHQECGSVLFATDTCYLKNRFKGLNNIMLECNYRQDILDSNMRAGRITSPQRKRIVYSHMSYNTCLETLLANDLSKVNNIVLLHLSDGNSSEKEFKEGIQRATGKRVTVADHGLVIENFNKTPF